MKNLILLLITVCVVSFSFNCKRCSKEADCSGPIYNMNLEELKVGQVFRFVLFLGDSYYNQDPFDFAYTGDTLEVRVTGQQNGKFILTEAITPQSHMMMDSSNQYYYKDSVFSNFWEIKNDTLWVTPVVDFHPPYRYESHLLLFFYRRFPLADFETEEVTIRGWKIVPYIPQIDTVLFTTNYTLLARRYDRLNIMVKNRGMAADWPGSTYIYSRERGFVKNSSYSAFTGEGYGWDRLD